VIFAERVHVVFQVVGNVAETWGELWSVVADSVVDRLRGFAFPRVVSMSTIEWAAICCFLATILGAVCLNFAVEALVVFHEFLFLGFGVLRSSATGGINVHVVSSLRGRAVSRFGWFSAIWVAVVWIDSKYLIQGFPPVAVVLLGGLPFDMLVAVKTYYCLWQAVGNDLIFEVKVTDPKNYQRDVGQEERKVKTWVLNGGGRQENSLRTVHSIS